MPDLRGLLADPEFNALPLERRQAILSRVNPQLAQEYVMARQGEAAPQSPEQIVESLQGRQPASAMSRFAGGAWKHLNPVSMVKGIAQGVAHPIDTAVAAKAQLDKEWEKAVQAGREGRYSEAVGHGVASFTPFVGPAAAEAGERMGSGDIAGGLGEATGMLLPVAGAKVGAKIVGKVAAPLKSKVNPEVAAAAGRQGVELPAAALSDSKLASLGEAISAKGIGGAGTAQRYTDATRILTEMADHTVRRASALPDASAAGQAIAKGLSDFRSAWTKQKNALYKQAALPQNGLKVRAQQTVDLLESIIAEKKRAGAVLEGGPVADVKFYEGLRNGLTKTVKGPGGKPVRVLKDVEARDVLAAIRELRTKVQSSFADPFSAANKGALKKVSATMDSEFQAALQAQNPGLAQALAQANAAYKEGLSKINSTFGKRIHKLAEAEQYDKIAGAIANSRVSVDDIPRILEVAGPTGSEGIRMSVLADVVGRAKNAQGTLNPQGLGRAIKAYGEDRLTALVGPEAVAKLKDVSTMTNAMAKGQRIMEGSQTAYLMSYMSAPALLLQIAGSPVRAFLASKVGQRWMTHGFGTPSTTAAGRVGAAGTLGALAYDPAEDE